MLKYLLIFLCLSVSVSCGLFKSFKKKKNTTSSKLENTEVSKTNSDKKYYEEYIRTKPSNLSYDQRVENYIKRFSATSMLEMKKHRIPASITLAQGILESGAGMGTLAIKSNNHFGIKCHSNWNGKHVKHDDDKPKECFRKYNNPEDSYKDHSQFLTGRRRYAPLFKLDIGDYEAWAIGLKLAGYATDPAYSDKLIKIINTYRLDLFDKFIIKGKAHKSYQEKSPKKSPISPKTSKKIAEPTVIKSEKTSLEQQTLQKTQEKIDSLRLKKETLETTKSDPNRNNYNQDKNQNLVEKQKTADTIDRRKTQAIEKLKRNTTTTASDADAQPKNISPDKSMGSVKNTKITHTVKKGETLYSISKRYKVLLEDVMKHNNLKNYNIQIDQKLIIPFHGSQEK